jgi:predicted DNA-binding protein (MmcQ/YjbR family)
MSFKCTPEDFAELTERPGIVPAPYCARMHWIALETEAALPRAEIQRLVRIGYDRVFAKLPKKTQAALLVPPVTKLKTRKPLKSKQR